MESAFMMYSTCCLATKPLEPALVQLSSNLLQTILLVHLEQFAKFQFA